MLQPNLNDPSCVGGRYLLHDEIAYGGTATIHMGRLLGPVGFARTVAIKRLHGAYARDPDFVTMLMDEARLAARIRHPNVVPIIDVVSEGDELLLVMDYIHGEALARLLAAASKQGKRVDPHVVVKIMTEALSGLHAAHEVKDEAGEALGVVHRDVSPQNILVSVDGVAHIIDFGVAKAAGRLQHTEGGQIKGKLRYMAPEQIECGAIDRRTDIFAAAAVLWEALVGRVLFSGTDGQLVFAILSSHVPRPSEFVPELPKALEAVVMKGLERNPEHRFATALEMADALESALNPAPSRAVARWMQELAPASLEKRAKLVEEVERSSGHVLSRRPTQPEPNASGSQIKASPVFGADVEPSRVVAERAPLERQTFPLPLQTHASSAAPFTDAPGRLQPSSRATSSKQSMVDSAQPQRASSSDACSAATEADVPLAVDFADGISARPRRLSRRHVIWCALLLVTTGMAAILAVAFRPTERAVPTKLRDSADAHRSPDPTRAKPEVATAEGAGDASRLEPTRGASRDAATREGASDASRLEPTRGASRDAATVGTGAQRGTARITSSRKSTKNPAPATQPNPTHDDAMGHKKTTLYTRD